MGKFIKPNARAQILEGKLQGTELPSAELSGVEKIRRSSQSTSTATPSSLRRLVFRRDLRCQWLDPVTGRKCGSRHLLELDHIQSRWAGGLDEPSKLRLLCRSHNNLKYRLEARIRVPAQAAGAVHAESL